MLSELESLLDGTIPRNVLRRGMIVLLARLKPIRLLFEQRRVPETGWDDEVVDFLLTLLSFMDTDKDPDSARIGEREARVASALTGELAHGFCHGVGRAGDVSAVQPKAAGGSLAYYFANKLALDMLQRMGLPRLEEACVLPLATGMALGLSARVARDLTGRKTAVFPRIDHVSPIKGLELAGLQVKTVEGEVFGDAVRVPIGCIVEAVDRDTALIVSTTTFFPPREPDDVKAIAKLAARLDIPHVINNAYGVQSRAIMKLIHGAMCTGRVDAVVQSTDKNFLTPIGGSIVASEDASFVSRVSRVYAGRASAAPIVQFLSAVLSLGTLKYEHMRQEQEKNRSLLSEKLQELAEEHGERLLNVYNPIAAAMTLKGFDAKKVGHYLYNLRVTGPRILEPNDFGTCCMKYHSPYITVNSAIGSSPQDVELAVQKLDKAMNQVKNRR